MSWRQQVKFQRDDDEVRFVRETNTLSWIFNSASSLKQQSADRYVAPSGHIILNPIQPVIVFALALSPYCCVLSGEATNTNFSLWFDPTGAQTHDPPLLSQAC